MRPVSRLLSVLLALVLLGASLLTVSAHTTPTQGDDYDVVLSISLIDDAVTITPGTNLTFSVLVQTTGQHNVLAKALLSAGSGYTPTVLGEALTVGGRTITTKEVEYTVQPSDLAGAARRTALIQFSLSFTPGHTDNTVHAGTAIIKSNKVPIVVVKEGRTTSSDDSSEVNVVMDMEAPPRIAEGEKVTFTLAVTTGKYWLFRSKPVRIQKQLYDANDRKIGGASTIRRTIVIRPLKTEAQSDLPPVTYTLTEDDGEATRIEFSYEFDITFSDLRDDDGNPPDLDTNFEETFSWSESIGRTASPTPTPAVTPTPTTRVVGTSIAATVTDLGDYLHVDRHDGGRDFILTPGYLAPNGGRSFNPRGYIRDSDLARGGQTYAVVRRESDNQVVRMWISPESPERFAVPWDVVNQPPYTVPVGVLSAIILDETRPAENQLARRFDANTDGRIYVFRSGSWHWIPDIPTFQAEGLYWCDVTAADAGFFRRAYIGAPLPPSGTAEDPNYPNCHSK